MQPVYKQVHSKKAAWCLACADVVSSGQSCRCAPGKRSEQSLKKPQLYRLSTPIWEPATTLVPDLATATDSSSSSASSSDRARSCDTVPS